MRDRHTYTYKYTHRCRCSDEQYLYAQEVEEHIIREVEG
jgi:hypothetical protein